MRALVLLLASIATTLAPQPAAAQRERQMGGVGITVFADEDFRGRNATFRDEVRDLQEFDLNDRISSLRVARGETWEVCEHDNFKGRCQIFSGDEPDLRDRRWNDIISSMRRVRGGGDGGRPGGRFAIELFADRAFSGERRAFTGEVSNLQLEGFNDRARSLRLPGSQSWEVCVDADYRNCRVVNSDWSDLRQVGMDRRISSLRPWRQGGGGGFPPPGSSMRLVLFGGVDYRGASLALDQADRNLGGTRPQSLQVFGGRWEVCDRPNFNGRCAVVQSNVPDVRSLGLRSQVRSARPLAATQY